MTQRFDEAWREARAIARRVTEEGFDVVAVRDVFGRASIVVVDSVEHPYPRGDEATVTEALRSQCAPFVSGQPLLTTKDLFIPENLTSTSDLVVLHERETHPGGRGRLAILDRGVAGREWRRQWDKPTPNRITLYGFKGGVGRSTATAVLARYLASRGKCVLAVDLDLESPGMSTIALQDDEFPDYGIVDYLVEVGVGNASGLDCVSRSSRLRVPGNGEVWIAPASGRPREGYSYLPKLNRAYLDYVELSDVGPETAELPLTFSRRLRAAVDYCALEVEQKSRKPDIVLLDSRAGIHDVAAVAITQMSDLSLLFGVDNTQTWNGYRELFQEWSYDPDLTRAIRERLRIVAAMVPLSAEVEYLAEFRDKAQILFSELYDQADPGDSDAYNPSLTDKDAPHSPLPIFFSTDLIGVDVTSHADWLQQDLIDVAFGAFVKGVGDLILEDPVGAS